MKAGLPLLALAATLAACAPAAKAPPVARAPVSVARPAPARPAPAAPLPAPAYVNWMDAPLTPGAWEYEDNLDNSVAEFGDRSGTAFVLWCDRQTRVVGMDRPVTSVINQQPTVSIRTETVSRQLPLQAIHNGSLTVQLRANDPLLDAMALSKGRFAVEVDGLPTLYLPSYAEVSRVIEDCRG